MDKLQRNIAYGLIDKLKEARKNKATKVELEDKESGFLRSIFRETRFHPKDIVRLVEQKVDAIKGYS